MMEEIAFENGQIFNFEGNEGLVTLTVDRVILHTYVHTYARTDRQTFETGFINWTLSKTRPKNV